MKYTVYLRTNKINGMQYVGQTNNIKHRNHCWYSEKTIYANKKLNEERLKYGFDNFETRILAETDTREEAWKLEKKYIEELNTVFPNGYNRAFGGKTNEGGNIGYHNGKEFNKGHEPWNKGMKNCFNETTLKNISKKHKGKHNSPSTEFKKGSTPYIKGKHHSEESKEKNRQAHLGKISKKRKHVLQFTMDWVFIKEFTHAKEAAKELGFNSDESIRKACKEEWRSSGGYKWKYKEDYEKRVHKG